jgi:aquaporin Z
MAETSPAPYSLVSRLIAEAFGTFLLVFGVLGAALFLPASDSKPLAVGFAIGISLLVGAYAVGHISGGHFNPAVTVGAAAAGRARWADVIPYVLAQAVGGVLAALVLWLVLLADGVEDTAAGFAAASNGFGDASPTGFGMGAVIVLEVAITAIFVWVILGVTAPGSTTAGFAPLAIGLTLTAMHIVAIPVDNASLNPVRSLAPAVFGGAVPLGQFWVFLVAPLVGALLAGLTWKPLFGRTKK